MFDYLNSGGLKLILKIFSQYFVTIFDDPYECLSYFFLHVLEAELEGSVQTPSTGPSRVKIK